MDRQLLNRQSYHCLLKCGTTHTIHFIPVPLISKPLNYTFYIVFYYILIVILQLNPNVIIIVVYLEKYYYFYYTFYYQCSNTQTLPENNNFAVSPKNSIETLNAFHRSQQNYKLVFDLSKYFITFI